MSSKESSHHILPLSYYLGVWGSLMVLTVITVVVAQFDFGAFNVVVAMSVATVKASLVALIFMHLWWDDKFNLIAFLGSFLFVALFFIFTFADLTTRGDYDPVKKNFVKVMEPPATAGQKGKKPDHGGSHGGAEHGAAGEKAAPAGH